MRNSSSAQASYIFVTENSGSGCQLKHLVEGNNQGFRLILGSGPSPLNCECMFIKQFNGLVDGSRHSNAVKNKVLMRKFHERQSSERLCAVCEINHGCWTTQREWRIPRLLRNPSCQGICMCDERADNLESTKLRMLTPLGLQASILLELRVRDSKGTQNSTDRTNSLNPRCPVRLAEVIRATYKDEIYRHAGEKQEDKQNGAVQPLGDSCHIGILAWPSNTSTVASPAVSYSASCIWLAASSRRQCLQFIAHSCAAIAAGRAELAETTVDEYEMSLNKRVLPAFGAMPPGATTCARTT